MSKLVHGFGINDSDYVVQPTIDGKQVWCPYYQKWRKMLERCYSVKFQEERPTYIGCRVCDEWKSFMAFRSWMMTQSWEGKQLDKDMLGDGKLYSPETCLFVSRDVNAFTLDRGAARGEWPIGVCFHKKHQKFRAKVNVDGKGKHLGLFTCPNEAHRAWAIAKQELGLQLIEQQVCIKTATGLWNYMLKI